jgi:hypothetical protein
MTEPKDIKFEQWNRPISRTEMELAEKLRLERLREIQRQGPLDRDQLAELYGQVWDTTQMMDDFDVSGFGAPMVVVTRRSDKQKGSLEFQNFPRFYFNFEPYQPR